MGIPLTRNGNRYRHKEHDSLVFTHNAYYWNSRGEHGNAIDYLTRHMGFDFISAVLALAPSGGVETPQTKPTAKVFTLDKQSVCHNCDKVKNYLNEKRYICKSLVDYLVQVNLIFQEKKTNNIIFPFFNEHNRIVGAELHGITQKKFKGIKRNSKYGYGFNVRFSNDDTYDYALFFESAIDLISFIDYKLNHKKQSLKRCVLISMAGLKMHIIQHTEKAFSGKLQVVLCIDNDNAGRNFKDKLTQENIDYIDRQPNEQYKDWSEQLEALKKHSKPIQRLMKHGKKCAKVQSKT